jgi:hypothetical protein
VSPAEIAETPVKVAIGMGIKLLPVGAPTPSCPSELLPHARTVPLLIKARECRFPASTDIGPSGVITAEDCANDDTPALLNATTRYTYVVLPETVVSANVVTSAPRLTPTCVKFAGLDPVPRYTLNPSSLLEASVQARLIFVLDAAVAWRFEGVAGTVTGGELVVALATFDAADSPAELYAATL